VIEFLGTRIPLADTVDSGGSMRGTIHFDDR
jgi:hypothetical protein